MKEICTDWTCCTGIFVPNEYFVLEHPYTEYVDWSGVLEDPYWLHIPHCNILVGCIFCTGVSLLTEYIYIYIYIVLECPRQLHMWYWNVFTRFGKDCWADVCRWQWSKCTLKCLTPPALETCSGKVGAAAPCWYALPCGCDVSRWTSVLNCTDSFWLNWTRSLYRYFWLNSLLLCRYFLLNPFLLYWYALLNFGS